MPWDTFHAVGRVASIPYRGVCWLVEFFIVGREVATAPTQHRPGDDINPSQHVFEGEIAPIQPPFQADLQGRSQTPGEINASAQSPAPLELIPVLEPRHEQEDGQHHRSLIRRRQERNLDRQRFALEQIVRHRRSAPAQQEQRREDAVTRPESPAQALQHDQPFGSPPRYQNWRMPLLLHHGRPFASQPDAVWAESIHRIDHNLPPVPEDLLAISLHPSSRPRSFDWQFDPRLPPVPEDLRPSLVRAPESQPWQGRRHQELPHRPVPSSEPEEREPDTQHQRGSRRADMTTELGDELDDAPPPAYGAW